MQTLGLKQLLRGASFVFACRVTGAVATFAAQVLLARWMGAEQMGVYVFAFSVCALLTTVSGLGMPSAALRFIGIGLGHKRGDIVLGFARRAVQVAAVVGVGVAALGAAAVWLTGAGAATARDATLLIALLAVPVYAQLIARSSIALGLSWYPSALLPNTVFRTLLFLAFIAGAWLLSRPLTAEFAMSLQLVAIALVAVVQWPVLRRALVRRFPDTAPSYETPSWLRTAAPLLVITLFTNYFLELNVFVAGSFLGSADLAVFNAALRTTALVAFGLYAVDAVTMPQISRQYAAGDQAALRATVRRAAALRFWGALAVCVPLVVFGRPVLGLFGEEFLGGYEALVILAASQVVSAVFGPTARVLSVTGYQDKCLVVFVVSLVVMIVLHPILIRPLGVNGAALSVFAVVLFQSVWLYALVLRHLGIHAWAFGRREAVGLR